MRGETEASTRFWKEAEKYRKLTRRMSFEPRDPGPVPVTKTGGEPWWPSGLPRPKCVSGHYLSFLAQIRLSDVPGFDAHDSGLLSFHYCTECQYNGRVSWGILDDKALRSTYNLTIFENWDTAVPDAAGVVAEDVFGPNTVTLADWIEVPSWEQISEIQPIAALFDEAYKENEEEFEHVMADWDTFMGNPDLSGYLHVHDCKLGGWPSWDQEVEHLLLCGQPPEFIAQFDSQIGENVLWGGGGHAFLFITPKGVSPRQAEMTIQCT